MTAKAVVILTALNLEYTAVRERLTDLREDSERGTRFEVGAVTGGRVVLGLTGKGNHAAGVLAERAIRRYAPAAVLFVGVAGAIWDTPPLGDVVVATHVYAYHGATSEDHGLSARPRVWEADHGLVQLAAHVARTGDWAPPASPGQVPPRAHLGPVAAGEILHNSRMSPEAGWLRQHFNDTLAIEMEAAGVAQAAHLSGSPVGVVRAISDRADGTKTSWKDGIWQPRAAANAAAFAVRLANEVIEERKRNMSTDDEARSGGAVHNTAYGTVGIQARQVDRSTVHIGAPPSSGVVDLTAELVALRERLAQERSAGTVDADTADAANAELDTATNALAASPTWDTKGFVLALKRLRGLTGDVADIATKIAALIAAVSGAS